MKMKHVAILIVATLAGIAGAQPAAKQPSTSRTAVVDAEVIMIGCVPESFACGLVPRTQELAIKITKSISGPLKIGDTPVVSVLACSAGPLLRAVPSKNNFVALDWDKIQRGSKIHLELEVYQGGAATETDKITVTKF
jgi:hypothetical protein